MARGVRIVWHGPRVADVVRVELQTRMILVLEHLKNQTKKNLSVPVHKVRRRRKRTTSRGAKGSTYTYVLPESRSKPGEFPRLESARLMRDIFTGLRQEKRGITGIVATSLFYGYILEVEWSRSFLARTFEEERSRVIAILNAPPRR